MEGGVGRAGREESEDGRMAGGRVGTEGRNAAGEKASGTAEVEGDGGLEGGSSRKGEKREREEEWEEECEVWQAPEAWEEEEERRQWEAAERARGREAFGDG